jgi:hypothetical protein
MVRKVDFDPVLTIDVMIPRLMSQVTWTLGCRFIGLTYLCL